MQGSQPKRVIGVPYFARILTALPEEQLWEQMVLSRATGRISPPVLKKVEFL